MTKAVFKTFWFDYESFWERRLRNKQKSRQAHTKVSLDLSIWVYFHFLGIKTPKAKWVPKYLIHKSMWFTKKLCYFETRITRISALSYQKENSITPLKNEAWISYFLALGKWHFDMCWISNDKSKGICLGRTRQLLKRFYLHLVISALWVLVETFSSSNSTVFGLAFDWKNVQQFYKKYMDVNMRMV